MRDSPGGRIRASEPTTVWNAVPLAGILVFGWDPSLVLLLYWLEFYLVILLNTPKIMVAEADRVGRLPDDVVCWPDGPSIRLGNAWLGVFSLVAYSAFYLVVTVGSPLWGVFANVSLDGSSGIAVGTVLLALGAMTASHLVSFRDEFVGDREYARVTPDVQLVRPVGRLWIFVLLLLFASGHAVFDGNPTALVTALVVVKGAVDAIARRGLRIQAPVVEPYTRESVPEAPPAWTGRPAIRPILLVWGVFVGVAAVVAALLLVGLYGLVLLEAAGWPRLGVLGVGLALVAAVVGLFAFGLWVLARRYRYLEYRVYPTGIALYNTRHDTLARFVPFRHVEECSIYRGILPRLFGIGSVRLTLRNAPGGGRFRTVFSGDGASSFDAERPELSLRALSNPEEAYDAIDRRL